MNFPTTIYVVDDDPAVRDALTLLLEEENLAVETFDSAEAFLAKSPPKGRGCIIIDVRMPGMGGMELHREMVKRQCPLPVIFLTGHGDIPMSVRAIKAGAVDFLTKPITRAALMQSVQAALLESERLWLRISSHRAAHSRLTALTPREREVMILAVGGSSNKEIGQRLGISHRTVEIHKARIMQKTGATTLLDLARIAEESGG